MRGRQKIPFKLISSSSDILKWYESNKNSYHFLILTIGGRYCQKCTVFESGNYLLQLTHRCAHRYRHMHLNFIQGCMRQDRDAAEVKREESRTFISSSLPYIV